MADLSAVLEGGDVRLEPFDERHLEPFRAVCALDQGIWPIYPVNLGGDGFDVSLAMFLGSPEWVNFAVIDRRNGELVGMTNYIRPNMFGVVEIGGTFIQPSVRGSAFNRSMKKLLIEHAFANGFEKIEFRVDNRNERSKAAVAKLGALREGTIRSDMVTWTGHRRDTALFGLLKSEWNG